MRAVAMACCSSHSVKKLARIGDTRLPMAVPNFCSLSPETEVCGGGNKFCEIHYIVYLSFFSFL